MASVLTAVLALGCASLLAPLSTERSRQRHLRGRRGWALTTALAAVAVFLLARQWGVAVAVAAAVVFLMAGIPLTAAVLGWRHRQERRHG